MKKTILLLAAALPLLLQAQTIPQKAAGLVDAYYTQHKFSGNVLIAVKNHIVFNKQYGYADIDKQRPNTQQTTFRAASLTKMFTAVLILQLAEEKKLSLADPVSKYVKGIDTTGKVTIRNLLSHTSGIKGTTKPGVKTIKEMVETYQAEKPAFNAGEKFEYNNFNFILLGFIAEKVSGKNYADLLKTKVLQKAGMLHSGIDYYNRNDSAKAFGYVTDPATNNWVQTGNDESIALAGSAGALYTTVDDLYKWSQCIGSTKLLNKNSWKEMLTPVQPGYGLGIMLQEDNGKYRIGHTGSIPGFIADLACFPKDSITIIYLSNYQDLDGRKLEKALVSLVYNEAYEIPVQRKEISLSKEALQEYTGTYIMNGQVEINLAIENDKLIAIPPGGDKIELTPEGNDTFFLKGPEIAVRFNRVDGKLTTMFIDMQGGQLFQKK